MALFDYRCPEGHTWTEKRNRDDVDLDESDEHCPVCQPEETCGYGPCVTGSRVRFESAPPVYFHGRGWARVDKNYAPGQ